MEMKTVCVRLDQEVSDIVERNAKEQGVRVSRYLRSLLEKGLVVDTQIHQGLLADKVNNSKTYFDIKTSEIMTQSLVLTRKLVRMQIKSEEQANEIINNAETLAREYISKLMDKEDEG